jgi:glycosyltransferase 2 family protein
MKALAVFLLKLSLTALCLWWAFSSVEIDHTVLTRPGALDFRWLAAGVFLAGLSVVLQALRWRCFLTGQSLRVSPARAIELTMIDGLFSLASVSGIGGTAARIVLLMRDHPGRKLVIAMAVTADHLAGLVAIAILFFIMSAARFDSLADPSVLGRGVLHFAWFYLGGGLAMVALIFIFASPPLHRRIHANDRFARWPLMKGIPEIYDVYRRNWRHALAGLAFSFAMLLAFFSSYFCGLRAVGGAASYGDVLSAMPVIDAISSTISTASRRRPPSPPRSPASHATPSGHCPAHCSSSGNRTASTRPTSRIPPNRPAAPSPQQAPSGPHPPARRGPRDRATARWPPVISPEA